MKKVHFSVMSDELCGCGCKRKIKLNVARRIQRRPLLAYRCWKAQRASAGNQETRARAKDKKWLKR